MHLTEKIKTWDLHYTDFADRVTFVGHKAHAITFVITARGLVFACQIISSLHTYDATNVMDSDNFAFIFMQDKEKIDCKPFVPCHDVEHHPREGNEDN